MFFLVIFYLAYLSIQGLIRVKSTDQKYEEKILFYIKFKIL